MLNLTGKTVLITGANRGIGLAFVKTCLSAGAKHILAAGRDLSALKAVVKLNPAVIKAIELDVTNNTHVQNLKTIKQLDVLINNAGIANGCFNLADNALDVAKKEMDTHYFGPMNICQTLMPVLRQSPNGAIINISSIAALSNFPSLGPYSATKAALMSFTQGLRIELADSGLKAVCVYPGPTDTRLAPGDIPKATTESIAINTFAQINNGQVDIYPDDFSQAMYAHFQESAQQLAQTYTEMHKGS
ncbi:SDR family NAD(P)-dependent oxidoreductase [Algibacillus agarilyticus]|uniref:SDR family NAD(P)-dependent oxidoreductase n=1 Tax=Algibacillus agarilyticus TaxID=2234133 RepID=UPI000DD002BE|nr:SDR family NAD(P)-dependent oxidoreductase [Algibacillus agarilyticus]